MRSLGDVLKFRRDGNIGIVRLIGEIDTTMREPLLVFFDDKMADGVDIFIIDLSEAEYVSSAIWGALITVLKHARERGGDIIVCSPKGQVLKVYKVMAFDKVFRTYSDVYEALKAVKGEA